MASAELSRRVQKVVGLELSRRPEQSGQDHRGQPDYQPDDPAGNVLTHENRAQGYRDPDDSARGDQPHRAAFDFGAAPLSAGHHALGVAPRLPLAETILTLGCFGAVAGL
jgi:hypothetical protein